MRQPLDEQQAAQASRRRKATIYRKRLRQAEHCKYKYEQWILRYSLRPSTADNA